MSIFVLVLFSALLPASPSFSLKCSTPSISPAVFSSISFDYLILGGGTAGLTVASRLAEDATLQIGVIEAGTLHKDDPLIDIPANIGAASGNPNYDWSFKSIPQPGLNGLQMPTPRGKMLGGSSGLNFLAWNRASKDEYNAWENFSNNLGWNWERLLPYFKKSTSTLPNQTNPFPGIETQDVRAGANPKFVGFHGPIKSSLNVVYPNPVPAYVEALNDAGVLTNPSPENGTTAGITNTKGSIDRLHGKRSYATEYYCRSASQQNLHVLTGAIVTRILLSDDHRSNAILKRAHGVTFSSGSESFTATLQKDVILSAGTIQTPQILELSGIGNPAVLESANVTTVVDLPQVGENLQDHLFAAVEYLLKPGEQTFGDELRNNATFASEQATIYNQTHSGVLAAVDSTLTFLPFNHFLNATQVDQMLHVFDDAVEEIGRNNSLQHLQYSLQRQWLGNDKVPQVEVILFASGQINPQANQSYLTILIGALHPVSRGSIHINSTSIHESPAIDPQYLNNNFDITTIMEGLKFALKLESFQPLSNIIQDRIVPSEADISSEVNLMNFIRGISQTGSHPIGTAAMGPQELGGVVDSKLRVYGTSNLRVVDASVIPLHIGAHLQSTVYAIAEKAAEIIREE